MKKKRGLIVAATSAIAASALLGTSVGANAAAGVDMK